MQHWRTTSLGISIRFLLASLIIFQAALSSAAMTHMDAGRLTISTSLQLVICTPDGIRTIDASTVQASGQDEGKPRGGGHTSNHDCGMVCCTIGSQLLNTAQPDPGTPVHGCSATQPFQPADERSSTGPNAGLLGAPRAPPPAA